MKKHLLTFMLFFFCCSSPVFAAEDLETLETQYEENRQEHQEIEKELFRERKLAHNFDKNLKRYLLTDAEKLMVACIESKAQENINILEQKSCFLNQEAEKLKQQIDIELRRQNGTLIRDGSFIWPCDSTYITSEFGEWRGYSHCGLDIADSTGNPVYATKEGRVVAAGYDGGMGYHVIIDHGEGVKSIYMHASQLYVSAGQYVSQGETIMAIGSTGDSTGPHLHFSITINGEYVNPRG